VYSVEVLPSAAREIAKLPKDVRARVARKIDALAQTPRPHGVKQLDTDEELYRVSVGDYRIVYQTRDEKHVVVGVRVRHRQDVYRGL
jgi:mRNA interferase RelE/StbE